MSYVSTLPTAVRTASGVRAASGEWQMDGACRGLDPERFFNPDNARGRTKRNRESDAKAVCTECPVVQQCLNWALSVGEAYGVWGGMTPEERDRITSAQRLAVG